jgi:hypothetical protein
MKPADIAKLIEPAMRTLTASSRPLSPGRRGHRRGAYDERAPLRTTLAGGAWRLNRSRRSPREAGEEAPAPEARSEGGSRRSDRAEAVQAGKRASEARGSRYVQGAGLLEVPQGRTQRAHVRQGAAKPSRL